MDIGGSGLTCSRVHAVAHGEVRVTISGTDRARAAWAAAQRLTGVVYGRGTGVGANKDVLVEQGGPALLRSHACGAGPLVEPERARAMLVVRLNQLLAGGSGVDPGVLPVLAQAINDGFTPPVRTYGAIGTGDLTALATTGLCLLLEAAVDGAARSFTAVGASAEPLAAAVQEARPHPGQAVVAARLRALLPQGPSPRVQDPYGYRAFAQVHGAAMDALDRAETVVETDLNSASENPLIAGSLAWHNGNFHSAPVALALDTLRASLVQVAQHGPAGDADEPRVHRPAAVPRRSARRLGGAHPGVRGPTCRFVAGQPP